MHRILILLLTILTFAPASRAQRLTAAWAFTNVPTSLMPSIAPDTRLDMVDYANSGSDKASDNELDGKCRITSLTTGRIVVATSDISTWELDLLPYRGDTIYMVLGTVRTPAPDTQVRFYDRQWHPLKSSLFVEPRLSDYLTPDKLHDDDADDVVNAVPFVLQQIEYDPETRTLTAVPAFSEYIPAEDYARVGRHLKPSLSFRYNGKQFKQLR